MLGRVGIERGGQPGAGGGQGIVNLKLWSLLRGSFT